MKKILLLLLTTSVLNCQATETYNINIFGYSLGESIKNINFIRIDTKGQNESPGGKSYNFVPRKNIINIEFSSYYAYSDNLDNILTGQNARKTYSNSEECKKVIADNKKLLIEKIGSPDMISQELIHFTDQKNPFKEIYIQCNDNELILGEDDKKLLFN